MTQCAQLKYCVQFALLQVCSIFFKYVRLTWGLCKYCANTMGTLNCISCLAAACKDNLHENFPCFDLFAAFAIHTIGIYIQLIVALYQERCCTLFDNKL